MTQDEFRQRIEDFLIEAGMTATRLGEQALNDPTFVHKLRKGRDVSLRVSERVISFMDEHDSAEATQ